MASSENQGLQAGLIISVVITVLMGVGMYFFYASASTANAEVKRLKDLETSNANALRTANDELNNMKLMVGADVAESYPELRLDYEGAVAPLADGRPEAPAATVAPEAVPNTLNYKRLLEEAQATVLNQSARINELVTENEKQKTDNLAREKATSAQINVLDTQLKEAQAALAKHQQEFTTTADALAKTKNELQASLDAKQKELSDATTNFTEEKTKLEQDLATALALLADAKSKYEQVTNPSFDVPHGEVAWVSQSLRTVWINLGREDGLRRQTVFSVYATDTNALANDMEPKGSIEVTRIMGNHLAEARIVEDDKVDPIIKGDKVHTATWSPGETVHVALAGFMDINKDEASDLDMLRNLITMSGAVIDAEVDEKGQRTGKLTGQTNYLIVGREPSESAEAEDILKAYSQMRGEAADLGVKVLTLEQFLKRTGWSDVKRVLNFSRPGVATDFLPDVPDGGRPSSTGRTSGLFRERQAQDRALKTKGEQANPSK